MNWLSIFQHAFISPEGRLRSGWKAALFFVAYTVVSFALAIPVLIAAGILKWEANVTLNLVSPFTGSLTALGVSMLFVVFEMRSFRSLGFDLNRRWFAQMGWGTLIGILLITAMALPLLALGGFHWVHNPQGSWLGVGLGFFLFLAVGINEESTFRGYPFQRLVEGLGAWPTQLIMALGFTLLHWSNAGIHQAEPLLRTLTLVNIGLAAILLGLCYLKTRSLALPIGVHLGWNWAQGNLLGFGVSGTTHAQGFWKPVLHDKPQWLSGGAVGLEGSVICTGVCLATILILVLWKPKAVGAQV